MDKTELQKDLESIVVKAESIKSKIETKAASQDEIAEFKTLTTKAKEVASQIDAMKQ